MLPRSLGHICSLYVGTDVHKWVRGAKSLADLLWLWEFGLSALDFSQAGAMSDACSKGSITTVIWLISLGVRDREALASAWGKGHLTLARRLVARTDNGARTYDGALSHSNGGQFAAAARWLYTTKPGLYDVELFYTAANVSCVGTLKWLNGKTSPKSWLESTVRAIYVFKTHCTEGRLAVAKWIHKEFPGPKSFSRSELDEICRRGHYRVMCWMRTRNEAAIKRLAQSFEERVYHRIAFPYLSEWLVNQIFDDSTDVGDSTDVEDGPFIPRDAIVLV